MTNAHETCIPSPRAASSTTVLTAGGNPPEVAGAGAAGVDPNRSATDEPAFTGDGAEAGWESRGESDD